MIRRFLILLAALVVGQGCATPIEIPGADGAALQDGGPQSGPDAGTSWADAKVDPSDDAATSDAGANGDAMLADSVVSDAEGADGAGPDGVVPDAVVPDGVPDGVVSDAPASDTSVEDGDGGNDV